MSGIYIPDMEMPKEGYRQLFLTAEGEVIYFPSTPKNEEVRKKAIVVPNHGDLIDRDALIIHDGWLAVAENQKNHITFVYSNEIHYAATVIPASGKEK